MKTGFFNSIIYVFMIILILGVVPDMALALDGQIGDAGNSTNSTPSIFIEKLYTEPEFPIPNSDVKITVSVRNNKDSTSLPLILFFKIYDVSGNDVSSLEYLGSINAGSETSFSKTWTTPGVEGIVKIDASIIGIENSQKEILMSVEYPRPDLIVQDIVPEPADPQEGQPLNFNVIVNNQGTAQSGETLATYYINGIPGQNITIPSLPVGASTNISFSLTPDQVKEGNMEVKVIADPGNIVLERNESNNEFSKIVNVKGLPPDLTIESISLNPVTPKVKDNITFTATVKNVGPGNSSASKFKYSINETDTVNKSVLANGTLSVPALAAGGSAKMNFSWTPKSEVNAEVTALADANSDVPESDESNNKFTLSVTVTNKSTPGGGGGNSGGGGSSGGGSGGSSSGSGSFTKEPTKNIASKELSTRSVVYNVHVRFDFFQNSTCVMYIEYDPKRTFMKTTTSVEELRGKSAFVPTRASGKIYKYFNVWIGDQGGLPSSIANGTIGFKVEKSWINNNSVNQSLITLQWYNKSWEQLDTEKVGEDENYSYFRSKTPGYSFFAITENTENSKEGNQIETNLQNTIGSLEGSGKKVLGQNGNKINAQEVRETAKTLVTVSLPLFLIFVGYLLFKRKI